MSRFEKFLSTPSVVTLVVGIIVGVALGLLGLLKWGTGVQLLATFLGSLVIYIVLAFKFLPRSLNPLSEVYFILLPYSITLTLSTTLTNGIVTATWGEGLEKSLAAILLMAGFFITSIAASFISCLIVSFIIKPKKLSSI